MNAGQWNLEEKHGKGGNISDVLGEKLCNLISLNLSKSKKAGDTGGNVTPACKVCPPLSVFTWQNSTQAL